MIDMMPVYSVENRFIQLNRLGIIESPIEFRDIPSYVRYPVAMIPVGRIGPDPPLDLDGVFNFYNKVSSYRDFNLNLSKIYQLSFNRVDIMDDWVRYFGRFENIYIEFYNPIRSFCGFVTNMDHIRMKSGLTLTDYLDI